jgi:hypothetical protein
MTGFWPIAARARSGDCGGEVLSGDPGSSALDVAPPHGSEVVAGVAVGPSAGGWLVGLALPLKVGVASRVLLACVERAPRLAG